MRIDRRVTLLGVMLVVLSTTMATQYATTKVAFSYGIVHPSNADIRFVGSDNSSDGLGRVLRVDNTTSWYAQISLGNWMPNSKKNYTAAFAIVNEENTIVNITNANISGTGWNYLTVWLHGNRSKDASEEQAAAKVCILNNGVSPFGTSGCAWRLGAGNKNPANMNGTAILTPWDGTSHVRYNSTTVIYAENGTRDFVWVEISLNIPPTVTPVPTAATGILYIYFKATTTA
jgi:hypothetical protein